MNMPIETFFRRIEDSVGFTATGRTPFTPEEFVSTAYYTISKSGLMADDVGEWRRRYLKAKPGKTLRFILREHTMSLRKPWIRQPQQVITTKFCAK